MSGVRVVSSSKQVAFRPTGSGASRNTRVSRHIGCSCKNKSVPRMQHKWGGRGGGDFHPGKSNCKYNTTSSVDP